MMETPKLIPKLIIYPIHLHSLATVVLNNYINCSVRTWFFFSTSLHTSSGQTGALVSCS